MQICLQTHHLDSPNHQEPISDPGDYVIEAMVNNYAFAQPWLTRQDIRKFAWLLKDEKYHNFHTSYSIGWLQMLMDYYDYTGDKTLVEEMAPYVHELMDTYASWRGKNGLISEAPNYMFMDWVDIGGFGCHHPPAVIGQGYLTAFYYHGLEMASRVAEMTGDTARVAKYAKLRGEIAAAFNRELWVADKGLYRDGKPFQTSVKPGQWLPADKDIETFSPHVNLLAVLYDLAPKRAAGGDRGKGARGETAEHAALVHALGLSGDRPCRAVRPLRHAADAALEDRAGDAIVPRNVERRRPQPRLVLDAAGADVGPRAGRAADRRPGSRRFAVRPTLCDLTWAKGSVPTPHGDVAVSWKLGEDKLQLDVTVPAGTEADVTVPTERFEKATVELDGRKAEPWFT